MSSKGIQVTHLLKRRHVLVPQSLPAPSSSSHLAAAKQRQTKKQIQQRSNIVERVYQSMMGDKPIAPPFRKNYNSGRFRSNPSVASPSFPSPSSPAPSVHAQTPQRGSGPMVGPPKPSFEQYSWETHSPQPRLVYARDVTHADVEIAKLTDGSLGFDLEWKPNFVRGQKENPVALVQLAGVEVILLIQVSAMEEFPQKLREVLESPHIVKAGVGVQNDCKKLWADWHVNTRNCVDLSLLARTVDNSQWKGGYNRPIGLARLCETYFQRTLDKGKTCRSNWEANLSPRQQSYAANDSHSGFAIYQHLSIMLTGVSPTPPPGYYSFDFMFGYLYHPSIEEPSKLWQPHNPNYDPGPPPEKKIKPTRSNPRRGDTHIDGDIPNSSRGAGANNRRNHKWRKNTREGTITAQVDMLSGHVRLASHAVLTP